MKEKLFLILLLTVTVGLSQAALIGHWPMDDGAGITATSSINSPADDGTLTGDAAFVPVAATFDGDGDSITTAVGGVTGADSRTIAAWIKTTSFKGGIVSWGNSWDSYLGARFTLKLDNGVSGALRAEIGGGYANGTTSVADGEWHHVAVTLEQGQSDISQVKFYIDGVLDAVSAFGNANAINSEADQITISGAVNANGRVDSNLYWTGEMADVRVYDEELTQAQIQAMASSPRTVRFANTPAPENGQTPVAMDTTLAWSSAMAYTLQKEVLFIRPAVQEASGTEPNWLDTANTYILDSATSAVDPDGDILGLPWANDTKYYWRVDTYEPNTPEANIYPGPAWSFTTVPAEPVIMLQPVSETAASVDFMIEASNADTYQWYRLGDPDVLVQDTGTGDGDTFTTSTEGYYFCVVSNTIGTKTSDTVRMMTPRLVGHWKLDSNLNDSSIEGIWGGDYMDPNDANPNPDDSLVNYVPGVDGNPAGAVDFGGTFNFVEIPDSNEFFEFQRQGFTLTAWLLGSAGNGNYNRAIDKAGSYHFRQNDSGQIESVMEGTGTAVTSAIPTAEALEGEWRFVALTYDPVVGERITYGIYDDDDVIDVLHSTTAAGTPNDNPVNHVRIGGRSPNANTQYFFDGAVDDVRIYNYPLTASDIQGIYAEMTSNPLCMNNANPEIMPYDHNKDCQVNLEDFAAYAAAWLMSEVVLP